MPSESTTSTISTIQTSRSQWPLALWSIVSVLVAAAAVFAVFRVLTAIDNSPGDYERHGTWMFWSGVCACILTIAIGVLIEQHQLQPRHAGRHADGRAARLAVWASVAQLVLYMAPIPFGIHRMLLMALMLVAAALLAIAALQPIADLLFRRAALNDWPVWRSPVLALVSILAATGGMLMFKCGQLGWAAAVD